jgi:hypothetical protein
MDRAIGSLTGKTRIRQGLTQTEIAQDKQNDNDKANKVNYLVHFGPTLSCTARGRKMMSISVPQPS